MDEYTYKRTTYRPFNDDEEVRCTIFDLGDGHTIRVAPFFHYIGNDSLLATEFYDGEWNAEEELSGNYDRLTPQELYEIIKYTFAL